VVAAYALEVERCYLIPTSLISGIGQLHLRLKAPRNHQRAAVNWAADYEFSGAIAQLGERVTGSHEVAGSSPAGSIQPTAAQHDVGAHTFRNHFGYYMQLAAAGEEIRVSRRGKPYVRLLPASP
jgi:prevent-host-death family protein